MSVFILYQLKYSVALAFMYVALMKLIMMGMR